MYCGDETGSFIGDVGSHVCRFGYGGEDNPKLVVPSYVDKGKRRMVSSVLHPPSTIANNDNFSMESILRMPDVGKDMKPLTDPNDFLCQGDSIESWDAMETAWETSMDIHHARDTKKHTTG